MNKSSSNYSFHSIIKCHTNAIQGKLTTAVTLPSGRVIQALIDTGADVSCIKKNIADNLPLSELPPIKVYAFNGETGIGRWTSPVTFKIFNQYKELKLLCLTKMSHDMILGMDILKPLTEELGADRIFNPEMKKSKIKKKYSNSP